MASHFRTGQRNWLTVAMLLLAALQLTNASSAKPSYSYQLIDGSYLVDDCPPCGRPTILEPMRGGFDLRLVEENPLFATYEMENIAFTAGGVGRTYKVTGRGTYVVGGEVALRQEMQLELHINDGVSNRLCYLTNETSSVDRLWPMMRVQLVQTNGTFTQVFHLELNTAPLREIWFSTVHGMTSGNWQPPTNHISGGTLLSSAGRVVLSNQQLTRRLGIMPIVPDHGLDALDILPGGEVIFSIEQDAFSESIGALMHGDLLSTQGRIVKKNQELTRAFGAMPPTPDVGLDALQVMADGETLFSIEKELFSQRLRRQLRRGDLLSTGGTIVKSNEQLVARFQPADPKRDYGLDAVYVWPSGEVWFSVETSFYGPHFEPYNHGDLLSDQGYVVFRNLELVGPFSPLEDLADFGLDTLFVITDVVAPPLPPRITRLERDRLTGLAHLQWEGSGRVWQVLGARNVSDAFVPWSPIVPELSYDDAGAATNQSQRFYQLRQW